MNDFQTLLLREKFTIRDLDLSRQENESDALIALSNRVPVPLIDMLGKISEVFIVRGQNMHTTLRFAARIANEFDKNGPLMPRTNPFDWENACKSIINDYEQAFNPHRWIAIYFKGKLVFQDGEHHPFLDVVEKCDFESDKDYDFSVPIAADLLRQAGKRLKVTHDSNVAFNGDFEKGQGRCGIILRASNKTTTFSYSVKPFPKKQKVNIAQALTSAAAFLEGVQMAFLVGFNNIKIHYGIIERFSKEEKKTREATTRLNRLRAEISSLESNFNVHYRPEKPDFSTLINDAEILAQKVLEPVPKPEKEAMEEPSDLEIIESSKDDTYQD